MVTTLTINQWTLPTQSRVGGPRNKSFKTNETQGGSTNASQTNMMVYIFTRKINNCRLARVNQTRVKQKVLDTGNQNPKINTRKLAHMWGS